MQTEIDENSTRLKSKVLPQQWIFGDIEKKLYYIFAHPVYVLVNYISSVSNQTIR
jgi:hypothetical protein